MPFNFVCIPIFSEKYIQRKVEMNTPAKKKSNAERCGELKKHLKDTNFKEKERIRIKEYREKKKKYQSEAEKLSQHEKRKLRKQKYRLAKKLEKK